MGDMNHDDPNYIICDMETRDDRPDHQTSGDIRDIAETIKDLIPGIDGEALCEELTNLAEEVRCMEDSTPHFFYGDDPNSMRILKNRTVQGPIQIIIHDGDQE